ncbi:MSHA biogenesis protein MshN [Marinobacter sp.]|uniref:tetratricopeptide repeat protein n=1 Tax=Marinobacter sp. TaxID=50741 RepID=UPI00384A5015
MSLLNDALRGAEQRQERPVAPAAYPGQAAPSDSSRSSRGPWLWPLLLLLVVAIVAAGIMFWPQEPEPGTASVISEPATGLVVREKPAPASELQPDVVSSPAPEPIIPTGEAVGREAQPTAADPAPLPEKTAAVAATGRPGESVSSPAPEPAQQAERVSMAVPEPELVPADNNTGDDVASAPAQKDGADQTAQPQAIKQQQETPERLDRRAESRIGKLLSRGRINEAERMLSELLEKQQAPLSRGQLARHLIVQQQAGRALQWLPEDVARPDASLRVLRARALLAQGQADAALNILEWEVPPVSRNPEYTVTLATLLQQQGRHNAAVTRWAELIEHDSSQGRWWVGLAIALEADQQLRSAERAYRQAMTMPGLPRSLAEYCRQRLAALRGG